MSITRRSPMCVIACAAMLWSLTVGDAVARTWDVSSVSQINSAVGSARSGDHIVIAAGTYQMDRGLNMSYAGVTIRGATGSFDDVILIGGGMNTRSYSSVDEGILVNTDDISIRDLTLKDYYFNAIHIRGENDADNTVISNVKTWNVGERHVKGSGGGGPGAVSDNVLIEGLYMLQTTPRTGHPDTNPDYIGGIDAMGVRNWIIRDSVAQGIVGEQNGGNAAIFLWQGVEGVTIERNVIIGGAKGIALGNPGAPNSQIFTYPYHAKDVVIRNNFILRGDYSTGNNIGLELCNTSGVEVYNNTFYSENPNYFRMISLYDENGGAALTDLTITNNIIRGNSWDHATGDWSNAALIAMGNIVDPSGTLIRPEWFVDPLAGDLHLTAAAIAAINAAIPLAAVTEDIDTGFRHATSPDMGADEFEIPWPGDANQDGRVSLADLLALADNYGLMNMATWAQGDFTRDGRVGLSDLSLLADYYGDSPGLDGVTPEPATIALLALGAAALIRRRRRV